MKMLNNCSRMVIIQKTKKKDTKSVVMETHKKFLCYLHLSFVGNCGKGNSKADNFFFQLLSSLLFRCQKSTQLSYQNLGFWVSF